MDEDPCKGKKKEFFIYDLDPVRNVCICTEEQMKFIAISFPEHYSAPIDILMWLYDMAEYREFQQEQKRAVKKPANTAGKKGAARQEYSDEDDVDYEETTFSIKSHKDMKKVTTAKKPAAPPSKPVFGAGK